MLRATLSILRITWRRRIWPCWLFLPRLLTRLLLLRRFILFISLFLRLRLIIFPRSPFFLRIDFLILRFICKLTDIFLYFWGWILISIVLRRPLFPVTWPGYSSIVLNLIRLVYFTRLIHESRHSSLVHFISLAEFSTLHYFFFLLSFFINEAKLSLEQVSLRSSLDFLHLIFRLRFPNFTLSFHNHVLRVFYFSLLLDIALFPLLVLLRAISLLGSFSILLPIFCLFPMRTHSLITRLLWRGWPHHSFCYFTLGQKLFWLEQGLNFGLFPHFLELLLLTFVRSSWSSWHVDFDELTHIFTR